MSNIAEKHATKKLDGLIEEMSCLEADFKARIESAKTTEDTFTRSEQLKVAHQAFSAALGQIILKYRPAALTMGLLYEMAEETFEKESASISEIEVYKLWSIRAETKGFVELARSIYELSLVKERIDKAL